MNLNKHKAFFEAHGKPVRFKKHQKIASKEDIHPWVYYLEDGVVQVSFSYYNDDERLIGYFVPDMMFAQNRVLYEGDSGAIEYSTVTDVTALRVPYELYIKAVDSDHAICREYRESILHNQTYMIDRVIYQAEPNVEKKFLRWVLFMLKYYGNQKDGNHTIGLKLTQETIADFLFVSRETINKTLMHFVKQGIISVDKKYITLLDEQALHAQL
jgi:CRP-like cAMP-binding protein